MNQDTKTEPILEKPEKEVVNYKEDPYRFVILPLFAMYSCFVGSFLAPYNPIMDCIDRAYGIKEHEVKAMVPFFIGGKIFAALFSGVIVDKIGLKNGLYVFFVMACLSLGMRFGIAYHFSLVWIGQLILGAAATLIVASQLQLSYQWFHPLKRGPYITTISVALNIGGACSLYYPLLFLDSNEENKEVIVDGIRSFNITNMIVIVVLSILHLMFFRSTPGTGYGHLSAAVKSEETPNIVVEQNGRLTLTGIDQFEAVSKEDQKNEIIDDLVNKAPEPIPEQLSIKAVSEERGMFELFREVWQRPKFKHYMFLYSFFNCINIVFAMNLSSMGKEFNFPDQTPTIVSWCSIMMGAFGSFVFFKFFINLKTNINIFLIHLSLGVMFFGIACYLMINHVNYVWFCVAISFYGFCTGISMPIVADCVLKNIKNISYAILNGVMYFASQVIGCAATAIITVVTGMADRRHTCYFVMATVVALYLTAIGIIVNLKYKYPEPQNETDPNLTTDN